jgi:hypothetical protein
MSPIPFLSKARGTRNLASRIRAILSCFGISSKRFKYLLNRYITVTRDLDCVPTFAITAVILKRHPKLIRALYQQGIEFAIHGYIHTDYGMLPLKEQVKHFKKAIDTFEECRLPYTGFRAPYLRTNNETPQALSNLGFTYDSSHSIHWGVIDKSKYSQGSWREYERIQDFYQSWQAQDYLALPRVINGFVEIPVSIPDDEIIVERLNITDGKEISKIWGAILESTYKGGELFTVQLHPERILYCENALVDVTQQTRKLNPPVWVATLREIAEWWQERSKFTFRINSQDDGKYRVQSECTERATLLIKNCKASVPVDEWYDGYQSITARDFVLESPTRPVIGISRDSSPAAVSFLCNEGFIVEKSDQPDNFGIYLNNLVQFDEAVERSLSQDIERSNAPLLRHWRWPEQARSALSITGDIDSITLKDFILRIMENGLENLRQ